MKTFIAVLAVLTLSACTGGVAPKVTPKIAIQPTGGSGTSGSASSTGGSASSSTGSSGTTGEVIDAGDPPDAGLDGGPACLISGHGYDAGDLDPNNDCQACDPSSSSSWTDVPNGSLCANGSALCINGVCQSGCYIGDVYYATGDFNPDNVCQLCDPSRSPLIWSDVSDGTSCNGSQFCNQGTCSSGCEIDGGFFAAWATDNNCRTCDPSQSTSDWSDELTGIPDAGSCSGPGSTCIAGSCQPACNQDSDCPMDFTNSLFFYCDTSTDTCRQGCIGGSYCLQQIGNGGGYCDFTKTIPQCKQGCMADQSCEGSTAADGGVECCAWQGKSCNTNTHACE